MSETLCECGHNAEAHPHGPCEVGWGGSRTEPRCTCLDYRPATPPVPSAPSETADTEMFVCDDCGRVQEGDRTGQRCAFCTAGYLDPAPRAPEPRGEEWTPAPIACACAEVGPADCFHHGAQHAADAALGAALRAALAQSGDDEVLWINAHAVVAGTVLYNTEVGAPRQTDATRALARALAGRNEP